MDMAGNSAESRFAADLQSTCKNETAPQEPPFMFVLVTSSAVPVTRSPGPYRSSAASMTRSIDAWVLAIDIAA